MDAAPLSTQTAELLGRLAPRAWLREPAVTSETAAAISAALGMKEHSWQECALDDESLRALADRHPAESVALLVDRSRALALLGGALELRDPHSLEHVRFELCALDWPQSSDRDGRPALVGIDLDWIPPPPPRARAKFPGGPGSAPANR